MTIFRDSKTYELTDEELYSAWHEEQERYYTEDVENTINELIEGMSDDEIKEEYGCGEAEIRELIPTIVSKYWDYNDSNELISDCQWSNREYAIKAVVQWKYKRV